MSPLAQTNAHYAKSQDAHVNDTPLQSTLREWRGHIATPTAICVFVDVAIVLKNMGQFGPDPLLRVAPRFGYWLIIIVSTFLAGFLVNTLSTDWLNSRLSRYWIIGSCGIATGIVVSGIVAILNGMMLGLWLPFSETPIFFSNIFVIAFVIAIAFEVNSNQCSVALRAAAALLDRLPYDLPGQLTALSVKDHHARGHALKGNDLVLMRLPHGIREVGETRILQVHHSHWVAQDDVAPVQRKGDGAVLTMINGIKFAVSRRNMFVIKDALPFARYANG